ncbi:response regulator transcription factor [Janibacter alittae]|uniref:Response regulator transcription factor n=1 Tax=Janibacter alittae TaxID=3115209 RepID=A0ABZ2MEY2_9MICO
MSTTTSPDSTARVLVIEDERALASMIVAYLSRAGYEATVARTGPEGIQAVHEHAPDVVILDLGLPGLDGIEVCRRIRTFTDCYIIVATARTDEIDTLIGLSVGADDYVTKPFSVRELVARVQTVLRRPRTGAHHEPEWVFGDLRVDSAGQQVHLGRTAVPLTPTERDLLITLASRPAMAFSRRQLIDEIWSDNWFGDEHLVDVHIAHLRKKLGDDPETARYIVTVRGVGYRMGPG